MLKTRLAVFSHLHSHSVFLPLSSSIPLHPPPSPSTLSVCLTLPFICACLVSLCFSPLGRSACSQKDHLFSFSACVLCVRVHLHVYKCVHWRVCVCERGLCCLGGKSTHRGPACLDLYYSLPFAIYSHTAAECERELLEYVDLFSMSI